MSELADVSRFRWLLAWLANRLAPEEIHKVQTLLPDQLSGVDTGDGATGPSVVPHQPHQPHRLRQSCGAHALRIFDALVKQNRIHDEDTGLLRALFTSLDRSDLLEAIECYDREKGAVAKILMKNSSVFGGPFFGRQDILSDIVKILDTDYDHVHAISVTGEAGIGKTRMANEACIRMNGTYKLVTVDLNGLPSMENVFFAIMHAFGVESAEYDVQQLYDLLKGYECSGPDGNMILLLDNADSMLNPGSVAQPNPSYRQFTDALRTITTIPNPRVKIMMTSSYHLDMKARLSSKVLNGFRLFQHNGLDSDAVFGMFRYHAGNTIVTYDAADDIAKMCGKNPLAIKITASRLQDGSITIQDVTRSLSGCQPSSKDQLQHCLRFSFESLPEKHKLNVIKLAVAPGCFSLDAAHKILKTPKKIMSVLQYDLEELKYLGFLEVKKVESKYLTGKTAVYSMHTGIRSFLIKFMQQSSEYSKVFQKAQRRHFQFYGKKLRKISKMVQDDLCNALVRLREDQANYIGFLDILKITDGFRPSENLWVLVASELLLFSPAEGQVLFGSMAEQAKKDDDLYAFADLKCLCYKLKQLNTVKQDSEELLHQELLRQLTEVQDILDKKINGEVDAFSKQLSQAILCCLRGELFAKTNKTSEARQLLQQAEGLQRQLDGAKTSHRFLVCRAVNTLKNVMKMTTTTPKTLVVKKESKQNPVVRKDVRIPVGDEESSSSCSSALEGRLATKKKSTKPAFLSSEDESSSSCSDTLEVRLPNKKKAKQNKQELKEDDSSSSCSSDLEAKLPPRKKTTRP
ncbi:uncharacterized protein [Amphiura filiformis]|uniref:uncharacterized protein n=1 Tax=Amphiura filiformis TaxID=82378 RepID=UPI003B21C339